MKCDHLRQYPVHRGVSMSRNDCSKESITSVLELPIFHCTVSYGWKGASNHRQMLLFSQFFAQTTFIPAFRCNIQRFALSLIIIFPFFSISQYTCSCVRLILINYYHYYVNSFPIDPLDPFPRAVQSTPPSHLVSPFLSYYQPCFFYFIL